MANVKTRILSFILVLAIVFSLVAFDVFAADVVEPYTVTEAPENEGENTPEAEDTVPELPKASVSNLGGTFVSVDDYYKYNGSLSSSSDPFYLQIAMEFVAKDTVEEAEKNFYGNYTTDFFITIAGLANGEFDATGCYLAGYYPSFSAWVMIPLDGMTIESETTYPVISSVGFDFKYTDICSAVQQFICGIYFTDEVLEANPNLTVTLDLGLSENVDEAKSANYVTVDSYTYTVADLQGKANVSVTAPEGAAEDVKNSLAMNNSVNKYVPENLPKDAKIEISYVETQDKKVVFDVAPSVTLDKAITFRLPVVNANGEKHAKIYHEDTYLYLAEIQYDVFGSAYVEITAKDFSPYAVEPTTTLDYIEVTDAEGNVTYLENFLDFSQSNVTIKLLTNVGDYNLRLQKAKNVTLDLNGFTFDRSNGRDAAISLMTGSELTIIDSSVAKTGKVIGAERAVWIQNGTLVLQAGVLESTSDTYPAIEANGAKKLSIEGGKIVAQGVAILIGENFLESLGKSNVVIKDGEIVAGGVAIKSGSYAQATTSLTITGGKIDSGEASVVMTNGVAAISGGTFSTDVSEYCVDGFEVKANTDGTYGVVEASKNYVAEVNGVQYVTVAEAIANASAGDEIVILVDLADLAIVVDKSLVIKGDVTLNNVSITGASGIELTVDGLDFTGNSWIDSKGAAKLTVKNVTANVAPNNGGASGATNSRSGFISLGNNEHAALELYVDKCAIQNSAGTDAIIGWAKVTKVDVRNSTFGTETNKYTGGDAIKIMSVADGAELNFVNNTVYSDYNGIVIYQNTSRDNSYSANFSKNTFVGSADHIWLELGVQYAFNGKVNLASDNTVNGVEVNASYFANKYHNVSSFNGYLGCDVVLDDEGNVKGGQFYKINEDIIAEGFEVKENPDGTYGVIEATGLEGSGTEADPFVIGTLDDLKWFRDDVNAGNTYKGMYVVLTANIDLAGENWIAIGNATAFQGYFDGGNKVISNLTVNGGNYIGLFGKLTDGTIKNVKIENVSLTGVSYVGAIVGMGYTGAITNCHVSGSINITGNYMVGGINGHGYAVISYSSVIGSDPATDKIVGIHDNGSNEGDNVGGIVGHNGENNHITNCTVKNVTVSGTRKVGGIVGITSMHSKITGCVVENIVVETNATVDYANDNIKTMSIGGIVGQYQASGNGGSIAGCTINGLTFSNVNNVTVSAGAYTGGMRGSSVVLAPSAAIDITGTEISDVTGATNKFLTPVVVEVGGVGYATLEEAIANAGAGDEIKLLADVVITENVTLPAGIKLNGNGFAITGAEVWAGGDLEFVGHTKVTMFNAGYNAPTITIGVGACLEIVGTGRMVVGHGATFNITGSITDAKTADKAAIKPSLILKGISFTGSGVKFNMTNAYLTSTAYSSSNKYASGTFEFNIVNSIWEQVGTKLAFESQSVGATVNFNLKDSVLTTGSHLVFGVSAGEIVIDNSKVNEGVYNQLENRSTLTIKNGSVVCGSLATSSNAINPGTTIVDNATYITKGEFSGAAVGIGKLVLKNNATVTVGNVSKADVVVDTTSVLTVTKFLTDTTITIDATNFDGTEKQVIVSANLANYTAFTVLGKADLVVDATGVTVVLKPVASVGGVNYATLEEAFEAATDGSVIKLLADVALDATIKVNANVTLDLNGKTITGTDTKTASFALIEVQPGKVFTVEGNGAITLVATNNRGWNAYSSVISVQRSTLVVNGGTIEHLGGTDMAYAIDVLTNTGAGHAEAVINGGALKSTYRAVRLFANSTKATTTLTVNGGTIEGDNRAIWVQNANSNNNPAKLNVDANATINGDVYLSGANATAWDLEIAVNASAIKSGSVEVSKLPENLKVENANGVYGVVEQIFVARVDGVGYTTIAEAFAAAVDNSVIELLSDVAESNVILIKNSITINGNGYKVSSSATRVFRITTSDVEVVFNNVKIESTAVRLPNIDSIRGISLDNGLTGVELVLNDCSVDFTDATASDCSYAVNFTSSSGNILTIVGGTYEGANVINLHGTNHEVSITGATLNNIYGINDFYYGCVIRVEENLAKLTLKDNTFNGTHAKVISYKTGAYIENLVEENNTDNTKRYVVKIGSNYYYTLAEAFAAAVDNDVIKLLASVDLDATIKVNANVTLDLNGKTITGTDNKTASFALIEVQPDKVFTVTGEGKITLVATNNRGWNAYSSVISVQRSTLVVEGGTIEHLGGTDMAYAIDVLTNTGAGDAKAVINGGLLKSTYRAVRLFANSTKATTTLTVNGGTIEGDNRAIWVQNASSNNNPADLTVGANAVVNGDVYLSGANATAWDLEIAVNASAIKEGEVVVSKLPENIKVENAGGVYGIVEQIFVVEVDGVKYTTLAEAFAAAADNSVITLLADVVLTETVVNNKVVTLDLNGFDISMTVGDTTKHTFVIYNLGTLTIKDETTDNPGEICLTYTGARNANVTISTIGNYGTLNVEGGVINCVNGNQYISYAIDTFNTIGNANVNISGGKVMGGASGYCIRMFLCSTVNENNLTVTGGSVQYVWAQQTNVNANKASVTVTGGKVDYVYVAAASGTTDVSNVKLELKADCMTYGPYVAGTEAGSGYQLKNVDGVYMIIPENAIKAYNSATGKVTYVENIWLKSVKPSFYKPTDINNFDTVGFRLSYDFDTSLTPDKFWANASWKWTYWIDGNEANPTVLEGKTITSFNRTSILLNGIDAAHFSTDIHFVLEFNVEIDGTVYTIQDQVRTMSVKKLAEAYVAQSAEGSAEYIFAKNILAKIGK